VDQADAGDDPGAGAGVVVHAVGGERRDLEERAALVEQLVDALAREQLAATDVALPGFLRAAEGGRCEPLLEVFDEFALGGVVLGERLAAGVDPTLECLH